MNSNIFEYRDYKKYLLDQINSCDESRGKRKELAEYINCQVSHITNVLSGTGHFNQEQAEAAARFFGLLPNETEFLLTLINYNRAGTDSLKKFYEKILNDRQENFLNLKNRLKIQTSIPEHDEIKYYSSWHFGAAHVLLSIPEFQTRESLANKMELPISRVDEILNFLVDSRLCYKENNKFKISQPLLHLDKKSSLISKHHINWRMKSIQSLDSVEDADMHYSSVFTLSKKDLPKVKEILSKSLSEALQVIKKSPEEEAAVICLDLFKI